MCINEGQSSFTFSRQFDVCRSTGAGRLHSFVVVVVVVAVVVVGGVVAPWIFPVSL